MCPCFQAAARQLSVAVSRFPGPAAVALCALESDIRVQYGAFLRLYCIVYFSVDWLLRVLRLTLAVSDKR